MSEQLGRSNRIRNDPAEEGRKDRRPLSSSTVLAGEVLRAGQGVVGVVGASSSVRVRCGPPLPPL